jgi:mycothiol synthase
MEIRMFTKDDYAALVSNHNSQNILWPEYPRSAEAWVEADQRRDPKYKRQRWVALENDCVVAFASCHQPAGDYHPQQFYFNIEEESAYQLCGFGFALYEVLINGLARFDPCVLRADAFTNLPQGFTFLQKRGFYEAFRETPVHLEIASFNLRSYAGLEPNINSQGIFIKTARELESDPDRDRKLFNLY